VNGLESHWSLFKRVIKGTHVYISAKHSWKYVSEFSYRRNDRFPGAGSIVATIDICR
jgi:transposase